MLIIPSRQATMIPPLKIAVADDETDMRDYFQQALPRLGYAVVASARNGQELVELCRIKRPDLVITDIKMPGLNGIDAATQICRERAVPVIFVSALDEEARIKCAGMDHCMCHLGKPVKRAELALAIETVVQRFALFKTPAQESADPRHALADRKVVERAKRIKRILVRKANVDEPEAVRQLQQLASDLNKNVAQVASMFVAVEETE
jgi:response regulator NasT